MTRKFKARTSLKSSRRLWYERARYQTQAYENLREDLSQAVKETNFLEYQRYGLVDTFNSPVIPDTQYLKQIGEQNIPGGGLQAFDFVVEAFNDLRQNILLACQKGILDTKNTYLTKLINLSRKSYGGYIGRDG